MLSKPMSTSFCEVSRCETQYEVRNGNGRNRYFNASNNQTSFSKKLPGTGCIFTQITILSVFFSISLTSFLLRINNFFPLFIMEVAGQILESYYLHNGANHTKNERTCIPTRKKRQGLPKKHILRHLNSKISS
jgi:hypothetical protein